MSRSVDQLLISAAMHADKVGVQICLNRGANVNFADSTGWTALHWAAKRGGLSLAQLLISHGAAAGACCVGGRSPDAIARAAGHEPLAEFLAASRVETTHRRQGCRNRPAYGAGFPVAG